MNEHVHIRKSMVYLGEYCMQCEDGSTQKYNSDFVLGVTYGISSLCVFLYLDRSLSPTFTGCVSP